MARHINEKRLHDARFLALRNFATFKGKIKNGATADATWIMYPTGMHVMYIHRVHVSGSYLSVWALRCRLIFPGNAKASKSKDEQQCTGSHALLI